MTAFHWLKLWNEAPDDPKWLAVADLAGSSPAIAWTTFSKALTHANQNEVRGSITGLQPQAIASWCRVPVDEIWRVLRAFREFGILIGDRIAKWAKRQTEKIASGRTPNAERQARHRQKLADQARQSELDLGPARNAEALFSSVTVTAEEEGESLRIPPDYVINTESVAAREGDFESDEGIPCGRSAPLEKEQASNVINIAQSPAVKAKKKEARRQKVIRFILATYAGEELERRMNGMLGADPTRDEQWWFDRCDAERILAGWDDVRDRRGDAWQRFG